MSRFTLVISLGIYLLTAYSSLKKLNTIKNLNGTPVSIIPYINQIQTSLTMLGLRNSSPEFPEMTLMLICIVISINIQ